MHSRKHSFRQCTLPVSGNTLQQVQKYFGVVCTSKGRQNREIDARIGEANAVLRELYRSVVTKRELSNTAKLSVFKSFFVPIVTYGHESWVMAERKLSQVQAEEMGFLQRVQVGSAMCSECRRKDGQGTSCWLHPLKRSQEVGQGPGGAITSPTLGGTLLWWSQ